MKKLLKVAQASTEPEARAAAASGGWIGTRVTLSKGTPASSRAFRRMYSPWAAGFTATFLPTRSVTFVIPVPLPATIPEDFASEGSAMAKMRKSSPAMRAPMTGLTAALAAVILPAFIASRLALKAAGPSTHSSLASTAARRCSSTPVFLA